MNRLRRWSARSSFSRPIPIKRRPATARRPAHPRPTATRNSEGLNSLESSLRGASCFERDGATRRSNPGVGKDTGLLRFARNDGRKIIAFAIATLIFAISPALADDIAFDTAI